MKNKSKGVSLIALIITIAVLVIIAVAVTQKAKERKNEADIATYNYNLSSLQQEVEVYINSHDNQYPALKETDGTYKTYTFTDGTALKNEVSLNNDNGDTFYYVDLKLLGSANSRLGNGQTTDDYYIFGNRKHNVYYLKGKTLNGYTLYGRATQDYLNLVSKGITPTSGPTLPNGLGMIQGVPNPPKLGTGMTPVKLVGSSWVLVDKNNLNNDWYDYSNTSVTKNKWANVTLTDGSMLVWIPRYTYKIVTGEHTANAGVIDIRFTQGINDDTTGSYRVHPAFYWGGWNISKDVPMTKMAGGTEATGIWVGKFEPSVNGSTIQIKPGVVAITNLTVNTCFTKCREMQLSYSSNFGISADANIMDAHMMKNSEWGAMAYLSKACLGDTDVLPNNDSSYYTGGGNTSNSYILNVNQSTTRNEYGIYDEGGCAWEYMASYINNGSSSLNAYGNSIIGAYEKYKDVLPVGGTDDSQGNYDAQKYAYGHAIYETSLESSIWNGSGWNTIKTGWFGDYSLTRYGLWPWVLRGGCNLDGTASGLFAHALDYGGVTNYAGFRVAVVVE